MTITHIDRPALRAIQNQFMTELKDVADRLGIDISQGSGMYGGATGSIKINLSVRDTGMGKSGAQLEFERSAAMHGASKDAFGKTFILDQRKTWDTYEVVGAYPTRPKYAFKVKQTTTGKEYGVTPATLKKHFPA